MTPTTSRWEQTQQSTLARSSTPISASSISRTDECRPASNRSVPARTRTCPARRDRRPRCSRPGYIGSIDVKLPRPRNSSKNDLDAAGTIAARRLPAGACAGPSSPGVTVVFVSFTPYAKFRFPAKEPAVCILRSSGPGGRTSTRSHRRRSCAGPTTKALVLPESVRRAC